MQSGLCRANEKYAEAESKIKAAKELARRSESNAAKVIAAERSVTAAARSADAKRHASALLRVRTDCDAAVAKAKRESAAERESHSVQIKRSIPPSATPCASPTPTRWPS